MRHDLESLNALLFDREFAVVVAETKLDEAVARSWSMTDDEAVGYLDPYVEAVAVARQRVESVKQLMSDLTPSSWQTNYR